MQVYDVGPHSLDSWELDAIPGDRVWVVVWYESDYYEGSGLAAALRPDGDIEYKDLGHCSCYGATDGWQVGNVRVVSPEEFLKLGEDDDAVPGRKRMSSDYSFERFRAVVDKARELLR